MEELDKLSVPEMLAELDKLFDEEEQKQKELDRLQIKKEMLMSLIQYRQKASRR